MTLPSSSPKLYACLLAALVFCLCIPAFGQFENATLSGTITDPSGAIVRDAQVTLTNVETGIASTTTSNDSGLYVFPAVHPGHYRMAVVKSGFRQIALTGLTVNVQDALSRNFKLELGVVGESVTVNGSNLNINTQDASVSTVVDSQFVENMPLNGRSFQSLIQLTPGVVYAGGQGGAGEFSVDGQRTDSNYFMVDGVSANFSSNPQKAGIDTSTGGTGPGLTSGGGTNGLISVDAMQEFRIQTSTYAPEFGRSPGAQISIVSKSGTNQFHGTAFDYLRNDIFDARNWFDFAQPNAYYGDVTALPKPEERQNDFGATLGGPIFKDKTFFFFSYEGLQLRLPQVASNLFYTASARALAAPAYQPFINALPLPPANAPLSDPTCQTVADPSGCTAPLTAAYSNPETLNATSIKIDHNLTKKITVFARYNHAPSYDAVRFWEELEYNYSNTDTLTAGATFLLSANKVNDFRANWSRSQAHTYNTLTNFNGAVVPSNAEVYPAGTPYSFNQTQALVIFPDGNGDMEVRDGAFANNIQRQLNFVDTFAWTVGVHQLKFGVDYRRMTPSVGTAIDYFAYNFAGFPTIEAGQVDLTYNTVNDGISMALNNYSLFAQDTWKVNNKLTLTYGLRWEINTPITSTTSGKPLYQLEGIFDSNPLALVPEGLWTTKLSNFAPRFGAAYQVTPKTVVRGGFGLFYDLGYGASGSTISDYPYARASESYGVPFDLTGAAFQPAPFTADIATALANGYGYFFAFDPKLQLPVTLQWNAAIERALGAKQTLKATYVGSNGRRLLRTDKIVPPEIASNYGNAAAIHNAGYSHYNALQIQFQRSMSRGLQALVSYNLSKSSDLGSYDDSGAWAASVSQVVLPPLAPSDYDTRQTFSAGVSYELSAPVANRVGKALVNGWAVDGLLRVTSVPPINVQAGGISPDIGYYQTQASIVPGQPIWIPNANEPGGKQLNPAAFTWPAAGATGDEPRNSIRNIYGAIDQTDLALRRRFNLTERLRLDVRAEYFNVFNHPMFGAPGPSTGDNGLSEAPYALLGYGPPAYPSFGKVYPGYTMNVSMGSSNGIGGTNPLYAVGGPRSGQFTLKLTF